MTIDEMFDKLKKSGLEYDKDSGLFKWGKKRSGVKYGSYAGTVDIKRGRGKYIRVNLYGRKYYAHHLAWLSVHGEIPDEIDHIDGDGTNNKIENLRAVNHKENMRNMRKKPRTSSGCFGVYWHERAGK